METKDYFEKIMSILNHFRGMVEVEGGLRRGKKRVDIEEIRATPVRNFGNPRAEGNEIHRTLTTLQISLHSGRGLSAGETEQKAPVGKND